MPRWRSSTPILKRLIDAEVLDLLEGHGCLEGQRPKLAQADVLNRYLDLVRGGVRHEHFEHAALIVLGNRRVRQRGVQEEERIRILTLKRGTDSAEVLHDE